MARSNAHWIEIHVKPLEGFARRIWSNIEVKCEIMLIVVPGLDRLVTMRLIPAMHFEGRGEGIGARECTAERGAYGSTMSDRCTRGNEGGEQT